MNANDQNNLEHIKDLLSRKLITVDEANVLKVKMQRVLVVHKLPREVRKALNAAVKSGEIAHKKKDGAKPEVYYHPNFEYLANAERAEAVRQTLRALSAVCCGDTQRVRDIRDA